MKIKTWQQRFEEIDPSRKLNEFNFTVLKEQCITDEIAELRAALAKYDYPKHQIGNWRGNITPGFNEDLHRAMNANNKQGIDYPFLYIHSLGE